MTKTETYEIPVLESGIHCSGCEATIQRMLGRVPGVQDVKASYKTQSVSVTLDPQEISDQEVREKLDALGYKTG